MKIQDLLDPEIDSGNSVEKLYPLIEIPGQGTIFANQNKLIIPIECRGFRIIKGQQVRKTFERIWERAQYYQKIRPYNTNESFDYPFGEKIKPGTQQFGIAQEYIEEICHWYIVFLEDCEDDYHFFSSYVGCISERLVTLLDTAKINMRDGVLKKIRRFYLDRSQMFDYQIQIEFNISANIQEVITEAKHFGAFSGLLDD